MNDNYNWPIRSDKINMKNRILIILKLFCKYFLKSKELPYFFPTIHSR